MGSLLRVRLWKGSSRRNVSGCVLSSQKSAGSLVAPDHGLFCLQSSSRKTTEYLQDHVVAVAMCHRTLGAFCQSWTRGRHTEVSRSLLAQARRAHGGKKLFNGRGACVEDPPPVVRRSGQKFHGVTCDSPPAWQVKVGQQKPQRACPPPLWQEGSTPASSPRLAPAQEEEQA